MSDAQRPVVVPLEIVAVPLDLPLHLPAHSDPVIARIYILPVGIDKTGSSGGRYRLDPVPIDVLDASFTELLDEVGGLCLQGSCQAQP